MTPAPRHDSNSPTAGTPLRVLLSFPGCHLRGGVERIVHKCAGYLSSRGHTVTVLAETIDPAGLDTTGPNPVRFDTLRLPRVPGFLHGRTYHRHASARLGHLEYDVLNTHGCVCPFGGVQWVQSVHAAWLQVSKRFRPVGSLGWLKQKLNPLHTQLLRLEEQHFAGRRYAHLIATTEQVRADLRRLYGVPESDVTLVPNGFDPVAFSPEVRRRRRAGERARLGLSDDDMTLLFVGNELERKGLPVLLEAVRRLKNSRVKVLVIGRAPSKHVAAIVAAASLDAQVINCGSTADVPAYHAAADVFVLPTQYEAMCLAILESLGSGLPVLTTTVPGAGDAIRPGVNGYTVSDPLDPAPLVDALQRMLEPRHLAELSDAAPATVAHLRWPVVLGRYEAVLRRFATSRPGGVTSPTAHSLHSSDPIATAP